MTSSDGPAPRRGLMRLYGQFWHYAAGRRRLVVGFLALLVVAQGIRLSIPYLFGQAVNALQNGGAGQDLGSAASHMGMMLGAAVLAWALHGPARVMERFTALCLRQRMGDALYAKLVSLPMGWHETHHSGETINRINKSTAALFNFAQHQFVYLQCMVSLVGPLVALFVISRITGATALLSYAVIAVAVTRFDTRLLALHRRENAAERRYMAELADCLGNISTVLTLRLQDATRRSIAVRNDDMAAPLRDNMVMHEMKWCCVDLFNALLRCGLVTLYGVLCWRSGKPILMGTAVMIYQYADQLGAVVNSMGGHWQDLVRYQADIGDADPINAAVSRPGIAARPELATWHDIAVRDLRFVHGVQRSAGPTLDDVSFTFRRGQRIALVGESGSGKSTLLRVLAGLYEAQSVRFEVDGHAVEALPHLGAIATLVPQDPEIFEASIAQNVTMGIDHPAAEVARALDLACFSPVLQGLPAGLATVITERGCNFSGGQKQRLALARGILACRDASLILLDEPTSSVDPTTEARLYDALFAEFPDACIISTLHRTHLLPRFDRVIRMAGGKIVEEGRAAA